MEQNSNDIFNDILFCVIDLETTGGNLKKDEIIEIGLVKILNKKIISEISYLVKPQIIIPDFIKKLTKISDSDLEDAPSIEEILDKILEHIQGCILVAHNASFDIPFFNAICLRHGKQGITNNSLCTNILSKNIIPGLLNSNLKYLSQLFNIPHHQAHRALEDARACAFLLINFLHFFTFKKIKKINHLYYPKGKFEYDTQNYYNNNEIDINDQIINHIKNTQEHLQAIIKGKNGQIISYIPMLNPVKQYSVVEKIISNNDWNIVTLKLMGPLIHGLLNLNVMAPKIKDEYFIDIKNFILYSYFKDKIKQKEIDLSSLYIISNHFMESQFVIYSLKNIHLIRHLVFRAPIQEKKIEQFILSTNRKKSEKSYTHSESMNFIHLLINHAHDFEHDTFIFDDFKKNPKNIFQQLSKFMANSTFKGLYPNLPL